MRALHQIEGEQMIAADGRRFCLTIPLREAVSFAMAWSDLGYDEPSDLHRQLVGLLAIDQLERDEQWSAAAMLRDCLREKWPDCVG